MNWRNEFQNEFSEKILWLMKHDKTLLFKVLLFVVNVMWFSALWQAGFPFNRSFFTWLVFFIISILVAIGLKFQQGQQK